LAEKNKNSYGWMTWLGLLTGGLSMLVWGYLPVGEATRSLEFTPTQMSVPGDESSALLERRGLFLIVPTWLRAGETGRARLTFEVLPEELNLAETKGAEEQYAVFVEARLDLPGIAVEPASTAGQILPAGRNVVFWWKLTGSQAGSYEGTAWLSLRFEPLTGGETRNQALAAPRVKLEVRRLMGLGGTAARLVGGGGVVASLFALFWRWKGARNH
jgi:hypothetical protein